MGERCETCRTLLSQGLDLCVRARKLDGQDRANAMVEIASEGFDLERYANRHNATTHYNQIATRSLTIPLWIHDQYERDLADWEKKSRQHLMNGCGPS